MRSRLLAWAVVAAGVQVMPAGAAPVPKSFKRSNPVTLTLWQYENSSDAFTLTVSNHTDSPISWRTTTISLAAFKLELKDEKGEVVPTVPPGFLHSPSAPPGKETVVEAGKGYFMSFRLSHLLNDHPRPDGKLTLTATFEHGGRTYQSDPLEVK